MTIEAILFDKDGTLFDFGETWNSWAAAVIANFAGGRPEMAQALADTARFDLAAKSFYPDSPIIAGTNREAAELFGSVLTDRSIEEIEVFLIESASDVPLEEAAPLTELLDLLAGRGLKLGVMTNDSEQAARAQLMAAAVLDWFDFVAGFDSGFGAKPAPDPLLAFCRAVNVVPERVVMVGDSIHDLVAGRAAGMGTVGVLSGMALTEELAPYSDVVLPHVGHIPGWLAR